MMVLVQTPEILYICDGLFDFEIFKTKLNVLIIYWTLRYFCFLDYICHFAPLITKTFSICLEKWITKNELSWHHTGLLIIKAIGKNIYRCSWYHALPSWTCYWWSQDHTAAVMRPENSIMINKTYITHWSRVTIMCVSKLTIIGSDNGLSPDQHQTSIWTNVEILLIWDWGTNLSEILIEIHAFPFKKMHLKMHSWK